MKLNIRDLQYKIMQGIFWMLYGLSTVFITVFMLSHGISAALIGTIIAVSNVLAAPGQVLVGTLIDKYERINWKNLMLFFGALAAAMLAIMMIFRQNHIINGVLFPAFAMVMYLEMPLINSSLFYYTSRGEHIDFGTARGMGSLGYALMSFVVGKSIVAWGEFSIVVIGLILVIMISALVMMMPIYSKEQDALNPAITEEVAPANASSNIFAFIKKYPKFMMTVVGTILVMCFHNMIHTYLILLIEAVGGDSGTLGNAFSIESLIELPVMFGFYFLLRKFGGRRLMAIAGFGFLLKSLSYLLASSIPAIYLAACMQMISYAVFASASVYYSDEMMEPEDKAKGQGYMTAAVAVGGAIGNATGGLAVAIGGVHLVVLAGVAFTVVGSICIFAGTRKSGRKGQA